MRVNSVPLIKFFGTMTAPATVTKSIGLPADAHVSWFLQRHLDSFIMTGQFLPIYRDYAKTTPPRLRRQLNYTTGPLCATNRSITI